MRDGRPLILIVDGDEERRESKKRLLEGKLFHVSAQKDAKQAMDYITSHSGEVDLMIADYDLHSLNGNGLDLIRMLRITPKAEMLPVVLELDEHSGQPFEDAFTLGVEDIFLTDLDDRLYIYRIEKILASVAKPDYTNVMEETFEKLVKSNAKSLGICLCRACKNDVITLALNNIKPRYVSSEKGRILASVDQLNADNLPQLLRVLTESAEKIKKNPRHMI